MSFLAVLADNFHEPIMEEEYSYVLRLGIQSPSNRFLVGMYSAAVFSLGGGRIRWAPEPSEDSGMSTEWYSITDSIDYLFGFSCLKQVSSWLSPSGIQHMITSGGSCAIIRVQRDILRDGSPTVLHGKAQAVFNKNYAEVLETPDIRKMAALAFREEQLAYSMEAYDAC